MHKIGRIAIMHGSRNHSKKQLRSMLPRIFVFVYLSNEQKHHTKSLSVFSRRNHYLHYPPVHLNLIYERFEISLTLLELNFCAAIGKRY